jgi:hypothetical protein
VRAADLLEQQSEDLAILEALQTGKTFREVLAQDLQRGIRLLRYYAGFEGKRPGEIQDLGKGQLGLTVLEPKPVIGVIRIDPPDEIFANKLCALLGRAEIRDLVDVRALEQVGLSLEQALAAGARKDGGLTAAQLAFVLSQIEIGANTPLPATVTPAELEVYVRDLIDRLVTLAKP